MKLSVHKRTTGTKGETNKLRREGKVPAILYGHNEPGTPVFVSGEEVKAILRNIEPGLLATTVFELDDGHKKHKAIVKEIQYHVVTYAVEHIDFAIVSNEKPVTVNVPIQIQGAADCVGVKLGGFIRQPIRSMKVSCLPKDIPQAFVVDVRELNIAQSVRLSQIEVPPTVRPLARMNEVAVIIGKKAGAA